jgi:hypothetical protein
LCGFEGCSPDLHTISGTLDGAATAMECGRGRALFEVLDERSRAALYSISRDRRAAARLIRADYPAPERFANLRALGDAAEAHDAADLFSIRCPIECRTRLTARVGAPVGSQAGADEATVTVRTSRGGELRLFRSPEGLWGLVWNTAALSQERLQASRELRQISRNAAIYRKRRALAHELRPDQAVW